MWVVASVLSLAICLKLLLLPLVLWLVITRRLRAAAATLALTAAACLLGWALIGFRGFADYPHLLSSLSAIEQSIGFSRPRSVSPWACRCRRSGDGGGAAAGLCLLAWRRAGAGDELGAFCLLLVTGLVVRRSCGRITSPSWR